MKPRLLPILLFALAAACGAQARTLNGVVSHVTDGDSVWVRPPGGGSALQVRLQGIDAPEICQAFGKQARDALAAHLLRRQVRVNIRARDVYQRSVGRISFQGKDVGAWLVGNGYAWSTRYQKRAGAYAREEEQARAARLGLWAAPNPLEPRVFRKGHGSCT